MTHEGGGGGDNLGKKRKLARAPKKLRKKRKERKRKPVAAPTEWSGCRHRMMIIVSFGRFRLSSRIIRAWLRRSKQVFDPSSSNAPRVSTKLFFFLSFCCSRSQFPTGTTYPPLRDLSLCPPSSSSSINKSSKYPTLAPAFSSTIEPRTYPRRARRRSQSPRKAPYRFPRPP